MKSIKTYVCQCGEDFYEDDEVCVNCGTPIEKAKLIDEPLVQIVSEKGQVVSAGEIVRHKSLTIANSEGE